ERLVDAWRRQGNLETEDRILPEVDLLERTREHGGEERAGRLDRHPVALAERTAGPAGVDQPDGRAVTVELLAQQLRVYSRPLRPERSAEAGREGRLRFGHTELRAGELRRVAGEEEEERLLAAEPRDRRQDPEGVGGQEDHRAWMPGALRRQRVRDALEL